MWEVSFRNFHRINSNHPHRKRKWKKIYKYHRVLTIVRLLPFYHRPAKVGFELIDAPSDHQIVPRNQNK